MGLCLILDWAPNQGFPRLRYRRSSLHWFFSLQHNSLFSWPLLSRLFPPMSWFLRWYLKPEPVSSVWLTFASGGHVIAQTGRFCSYLYGQRGLEHHSHNGKCWITFDYWLSANISVVLLEGALSSCPRHARSATLQHCWGRCPSAPTTAQQSSGSHPEHSQQHQPASTALPEHLPDPSNTSFKTKGHLFAKNRL